MCWHAKVAADFYPKRGSQSREAAKLAPTLTTISPIAVNADELAYQFRPAKNTRCGQ